jgi:hypothetical protein
MGTLILTPVVMKDHIQLNLNRTVNKDPLRLQIVRLMCREENFGPILCIALHFTGCDFCDTIQE